MFMLLFAARPLSLGVLSASLLCVNAVHAASTAAGLLNDTGQTTCDNGSGVLLDCKDSSTKALPGQDGHLGLNAEGKAGFDFTKICKDGSSATCTDANPWECTRDNRTKLIWSLQTKQSSNTFTGNTKDNLCNSTGWRLPTRRELLGIAHSGKTSPAIDTEFFPGTTSGAYWTSDLWAVDGSFAWTVDFKDGAAARVPLTIRLNYRLVREDKQQ